MHHEISFNPRAAVPDFGRYQRARQALNDAARSALSHGDVVYGPHERHRLDVYLPERNPAGDVHLYFHGGYWRAGDKSNFAFLAQALAEQGIAVVVPHYALCGPSSFESVLASARAAFEWVVDNAQRHAWSPHRISLSGHSAGAYLCAHILATASSAWEARSRVIGVTLVSGVYTPAVAIGTSVNAELRFERPHIDAFDLADRPWAHPAPSHVFAGAQEPLAWIGMSSAYAASLNTLGSSSPQLQLLAGHDHFSILDEYRADGCIHRAICAQHARPSPMSPRTEPLLIQENHHEP